MADSARPRARQLLVAFLSARAPRAHEPDPLVRAAAAAPRARAAWRPWRASWPSASATCAGWSAAEVGYGPKRLGRVLRLRRALARRARGRRAGGGRLRGRLRRPGPLHQRVPRAGRRAAWPFSSRRRRPERASIAGMTETAKLGWVIVYVPDVEAAIAFYEQAFGLERGFVAEDGELRRARHGPDQARVRVRGAGRLPLRAAASSARAPSEPVQRRDRARLRRRPRRRSPAPSRAARPRSPSPTASRGARRSPTCATRSARSWSWPRRPTDRAVSHDGARWPYSSCSRSSPAPARR